VPDTGRLSIVTGEIGSGKSTRIRQIVDSSRKAGQLVKGLVTEVRNGERWTIDLSTGHAWVLAHPNEGQTGLSTPRYVFDEAGLAHANQVLQASRGAEVLVIDELGPLELLRSQGWVEALEILDSRHFDQAFVVIRESLLPVALSRWPFAEVNLPVSSAKLDLDGNRTGSE
jgi:nucleoside-triphosphatase